MEARARKKKNDNDSVCVHNNKHPILNMYMLHILISLLASLTLQSCLVCNGMASSSQEEMETDGLIQVPTGTLSNGIHIPLVGLGCASGVRKQHVKSALEQGYRFLDTAQSYNWGYHEDDVGSALHEFMMANNGIEIDNRKVFIQTKIHPEDLGYDATKRAIEVSLKRLKVSTIDSVLIHKPRCWEGACRKQPEGTWQDSWKALEEYYKAGTIRAIGICDVTDSLLDELLQQEIPPHIIQNWMDPIHQDKNIRNRCQREGIQYQAYSTLGTQWVHHRGIKENPVLQNSILLQIARKYNVDVAQIVIQWATKHHNMSVLPASTDPQRQYNNLFHSFEFELTQEEVKQIDAIDGQAPNPQKPNPNAVHVTFENQSEGPINAYWISDDGSEILITKDVSEGDSFPLDTYHGHNFVFRDVGSSMFVGEHTISRDNGKDQRHIVGGRVEL